MSRIRTEHPDPAPDDGQRNCPKHVEFYSKNKFEKLMHLVGFIIRIYHDARSPEHQITTYIHIHVCQNIYIYIYFKEIIFILFNQYIIG